MVRILYDLNLIENYASGFERIFAAYKNENKKPTVDDLNVSLKVTLPNMNYDIFKNGVRDSNLSDQEIVILDFLNKHESMRRTTVEDLLGVGSSRAGEILQEMLNKSLIKREGTARNTKYFIK